MKRRLGVEVRRRGAERLESSGDGQHHDYIPYHLIPHVHYNGYEHPMYRLPYLSCLPFYAGSRVDGTEWPIYLRKG